MNPAQYVSALTAQGVDLWVTPAGDLGFKAPRGVMNAEAKESLEQEKPRLVAYLRSLVPDSAAVPQQALLVPPFAVALPVAPDREQIALPLLEEISQAALPVPQLGRLGEAPPVDSADVHTLYEHAPALEVEPVAMFFPANSGFAVGLVETWKSQISDTDYRQIMRALPDLAKRGAFPLPTSTEEGDLPLMQGQTVQDVNRFVLLTVERIRYMQCDLAAFAPGRTNGTFCPSGRKLLEGRYRERVMDALALAALHFEAVAAWYFGG